MAKKQTPRSPEAVEWTGGIARLSSKVDVGGVSIQPDILIWMDEKGAVLDFELGKPGGMLDTAIESLRAAMTVKGQPKRLRVPSPKLADALGKAWPKIEIVCAPTPELDAMLKVLEEQLRKDPPKPSPKQLEKVPGVETQAAVLQAVARLTKLKPWTVVPDFRHAITMTVGQCDVRGGALSLSHDEDGLKITLLRDRDDFNAMVAYEEQVEQEDRELEAMGDKEIDEAEWFNRPRLKMPPFQSLTFDPGTKPPQSSPILASRKEGWEPISPDSSIWFLVREKDQPPRHPTLKEAILMEAVLLALPEFLKEKEPLQAAWQNGTPFSRTIAAATHVGEIEVMLGAP